MSKKINPKSLRLGSIQLWSQIIQNYGNNLFIFIKYFYKYIKVLNSLFKIFNNFYIFFLQEIIYFNSKLIINFWFYKINYLFYFNYFKNLVKLIYYWNPNKKIFIRFYFPNLNQFCYSLILVNYSSYLITVLNYTPKKVLGILSILINLKINYFHIFYSKNGPIKTRLKGFKVVFNGCFENTKLQMAETLELKIGSLKLVSFKNKVDFSSKLINTKLGSLNLKIWLFFETI